MPPKKQLSAEQIADLTQWIEGRRRLAAAAVPVDFGKPNPAYDELRKEHWAWQPLARARRRPRCAMPPGRATTSTASSWPRWKSKDLQPVGDADRLTLIRRVTFDLTGLPPTPAEIDAFVADASADAFETVGRSPAGVAGVRRALGPALARRGPLRRIDRLVAQPALSARLAVSRLRHRRVQRRQAVRPVHPRADRRRPAARRVAGSSATSS